ncbi:MAG: large subunit ribosomal protein L18e [Patescibacteria group bacterium]|jgi:large subunit ribosomal protein L18e
MRAISKTKIEKRMQQKKDNTLIETIIKLKKTNPELAKDLARPKRRWPGVNLKELSHVEGDVVVPGKVLSAGDLSVEKRIVAWSFSEKARTKIAENNGTAILITEEIIKNPELNGLSIVR